MLQKVGKYGIGLLVDIDCLGSGSSDNLLGKSLNIDLNEIEVFAQVKTVALKVKQQADGSDSTRKKKKKSPLIFLIFFSFHLQLEKGDHLTNSNSQC